MKNLHVLPTDKPSRLHLYTDEKGTILETCELEYSNTRNTQHIYITNSEEIKFNDYITDGYKIWQWKDDSSLLSRKKVILTTDQDLIKDNVQPIDDEFLEWFVKNPSCEFVEILIKTKTFDKDGFISSVICDTKNVEKIYSIIPQEELKQEYQSECICDTECRGFVNVKCKNLNKQETLEEAVNAFKKTNVYTNEIKQKQERMYSEEDMIEFGKYLLQLSNSAMSRKFNMKMLDSETGIKLTKDLFEQFKKK
jgi:hypothetical protein